MFLRSYIILHSGEDKEIFMHHLDYDSGQLKLWNMSLKFCILECEYQKVNISATVSPKSIWSYATECYVGVFSYFLPKK